MPGTVTTGHPLARPRERKAHPTPLLRTILGKVLRRTRREQDRTLREVAQTARVSIAYLSELERGRKEASSEVLAAICDALQIDLAELLTEVGRVLAGTQSHAGRQTLVRAGVAPQVRRGVARPDNVVRLAEFRDRRAQQIPLPRARRVRDSGVVLLRAAA